jgi:hypothetical protein
VPVEFCTDVADPLARLAAVCRATREAKRNAEAMGLDFTPSLVDAMPSAVTDLAPRGIALPGLNVAVSNMRGPDAPLYLAGAGLAHRYPVSTIADGQGLNLTAVSYDGVLALSAVACRQHAARPRILRRLPARELRRADGGGDSRSGERAPRLIPLACDAGRARAGGRPPARARSPWRRQARASATTSVRRNPLPPR